MNQPTVSGAEKNAATYTRSQRLNKSQMVQRLALQSRAWWPFDQADPKVLSLMHRSIAATQTATTDLPDALF